VWWVYSSLRPLIRTFPPSFPIANGFVTASIPSSSSPFPLPHSRRSRCIEPQPAQAGLAVGRPRRMRIADCPGVDGRTLVTVKTLLTLPLPRSNRASPRRAFRPPDPPSPKEQV
jgi:hypothetical protein